MARRVAAVVATERVGRRCLLWLFAACCPLPASAGEKAATSVLVYADTDHVTVWKPLASAAAEFGQTTLRTTLTTDFISAASVDLVSAASPRGYTERRNEAQLGGGYDFGDGTRLDVDGAASREPDFRSQSVSASGSVDWRGRRITTVGSLGLATAATGRAGDDTAWRDRSSRDANLQASIILTQETVLDAIYSLQQLHGYQASLYRYVRLFRGDSPQHETAVTENVPDQRYRHAATVRMRQRWRPDLFGMCDYRWYADTWGMVAHTASVRATWTLPYAAWTVTAEARGHRQSGATFYQGHYATLPEAPLYRTADKELGPLWTLLGGLHLEWSRMLTRTTTLRVDAGADVLHLRYLDHPYLQSRTALLTTVGIVVEK